MIYKNNKIAKKWRGGQGEKMGVEIEYIRKFLGEK